MAARQLRLMGSLLALMGVMLFFNNCSQSGFDGVQSLNQGSSQSPPPPATNEWNVGTLTFIEGGGTTIDLANTLPPEIKRNGTFAVDPSGANLPPGMNLSASGLLSVSTAAAGDTIGVVFNYTEP
ncbi:MAG: hypothetical protein AB7N80_14850 [Bdellovibrionales bacterium]